MFRFDGFRGGELAARNALRSLDESKFPRSQAGFKIGAYLGMGDFAHPATEPVADERPFVNYGFTLEVFIAGKGDTFPNAVERVDRLLLMLRPFACGAYNGVGLVPKVCRQLPVRGHYLSRRVNLFAVAR
jgi:hypothetical protein